MWLPEHSSCTKTKLSPFYFEEVNLVDEKHQQRFFLGVVRTNKHLNPLTPKGDQHIISHYNVTSKSNIKVTRIKEMITNKKSSKLLNKFSLSALKEMYRKQYGEYAYWCYLFLPEVFPQFSSWTTLSQNTKDCRQPGEDWDLMYQDSTRPTMKKRQPTLSQTHLL